MAEILHGFANLADQFGERVSRVGEEHVSAAIGLTLERHNAMLNAMLSVFATPTTQYQINFRSLCAAKLQPMDENGRPLPIKTSKYTVAFPLAMAGAALGENFVTAAKMTVRDVNDRVAQVLMADVRWVRDQLLAAIFTDTSRTYVDDDFGDLTVQPFANDDAVAYVKQNGDKLETDNHYLAQAGVIADGANPFPAIRDELREHPENQGEVVVFIPTANRSAVEGLAGFVDVADPNVRPGANSDVLTGVLGVTHPGTVIGYVNNCWVVEWSVLPDNYLIGTTTAGDSPLLMRQDPEAELNGLILRGPEEQTPFTERFWYRRLGFGANNRVGIVVQRVGNGAYAEPTGYTAPIP